MVAGCRCREVGRGWDWDLGSGRGVESCRQMAESSRRTESNRANRKNKGAKIGDGGMGRGGLGAQAQGQPQSGKLKAAALPPRVCLCVFRLHCTSRTVAWRGELASGRLGRGT